MSSDQQQQQHVSVSSAASLEKTRRDVVNGDHAAPPAAARHPSSSSHKKRKRGGPFRIKAGCIVALRYRPGGNTVKPVSMVEENGDSTFHEIEQQHSDSSEYAEIWAEPLPHRDGVNASLIGRRIRCSFPKKSVKKDQRRMVEGEVIRVMDGHAVELLVDQDVLQDMPFLERTGGDDHDMSALSNSEKKRQQLEDKIRGKDKVTVKIHLVTEGTKSSKQLTAKWVIRKRVAIWGKQKTEGKGETNGKKKRKYKKSETRSRYIGDGRDKKSQQERNFRWLAGRMEDTVLRQTLDSDKFSRAEDLPLSFGMVGEVLRVTPSTTPSSDSLATVTMRRMVLPEHTQSGRMPHHGQNAIFDDADAMSSDVLYQVPVEEVVIVYSHLDRRPVVSSTNGSMPDDSEGPVVSLEYSLQKNCFELIKATKTSCDEPTGDVSTNNTQGNGETRDVCHRCRKVTWMVSKKRVVSRRGSGKAIEWGYFCQQCHDAIKAHGKEKAGARFCLPCDCQSCSEGTNAVLESMLGQSVKQANSVFAGSSKDSNGESGDSDSLLCAVCGNVSKSGVCCSKCGVQLHKQCMIWDLSLDGNAVAAKDQKLCRACRGEGVSSNSQVSHDAESAAVASSVAVLSHMRPVDFELPSEFLDVDRLPIPSLKQLTKTRKIVATRKRKTQVEGAGVEKKKRKKVKLEAAAEADVMEVSPESDKKSSTAQTAPTPQADEEEGVFKPTCSRLIPYEPHKKGMSGTRKASGQEKASAAASPEPPQSNRKSNARQGRKRTRESASSEKKTTSRAARANQRRMVKDVAAIGASSLELDLLAGREAQLRFDRSSIHAWGVFADVDMSAGDMVVEYRGELISNAMAEKREKEYELAKIGSDYMFRIDGFTVCDATKQGNVARFINASCDPNCYTQIVTLKGVKRIVIYAKKDIHAGQELCYDYKFPFEFDESKRIPCHCGASNCRGFMNWDKRYVALPAGQTKGLPGV